MDQNYKEEGFLAHFRVASKEEILGEVLEEILVVDLVETLVDHLEEDKLVIHAFVLLEEIVPPEIKFIIKLQLIRTYAARASHNLAVSKKSNKMSSKYYVAAIACFINMSND